MRFPKPGRCRDCVHYIWGYATSTQQHETRVCAMKPKQVRCDTALHPRQYYYITLANRTCSDFSKREDNED